MKRSVFAELSPEVEAAADPVILGQPCVAVLPRHIETAPVGQRRQSSPPAIARRHSTSTPVLGAMRQPLAWPLRCSPPRGTSGDAAPRPCRTHALAESRTYRDTARGAPEPRAARVRPSGQLDAHTMLTSPARSYATSGCFPDRVMDALANCRAAGDFARRCLGRHGTGSTRLNALVVG